MRVIFYSTHCPRCKVLEVKLQKKGIEYEEHNDKQEMLALGLQSAPALSVDGQLMTFKAAIDWINAQEANGSN